MNRTANKGMNAILKKKTAVNLLVTVWQTDISIFILLTNTPLKLTPLY